MNLLSLAYIMMHGSHIVKNKKQFAVCMLQQLMFRNHIVGLKRKKVNLT